MCSGNVSDRAHSRRGELEVLIVGAGFGGIAAAIELRRHGIEDVTILEQAPDLGGTWFYNTYPGAACDVPSHLYSFSFAQRRDWSRLCSPQQEIHDYLHEVARDHGVDRLISTGQTVTACSWDERALPLDGRDLRGRAPTRRTRWSSPPASCTSPRAAHQGAEEFAGHSFHSAAWDHDYDLAGKRVAVVGTGASAVQFVPEIAPQVAPADRLPAHRQLVPAAQEPPLPGARCKAPSNACPGLQACGGASCSSTPSR